ncbi:NADH-quinone oxidoreductase subunit J [Actinomyces bovis]|uniref:NADH-quinone oxidoreductase subunit J n=1 Tax=Actinomyces bovis TaxID=1658 RepID=A0ABY1VMB6_9ACTO|nr:NADH-quinone oxidoreductase subunit J [Actinomyces bovis]SPT53254.1 NADH-quinone oxidoreductase subunit J [Actinomyces bovis]VEG52523.1 NADH-quinone oxidoreductase subunit J [Actinomyces israelii]
MNAQLSSALLPAAVGSTGNLTLGETVLFAAIALATVACGIGVLTAKRAVHAAINMIAIMVCLAILYLANEAPFMGITQVVVYTGAVMTLVMFVIMLVGLGGDEPTAGTSSPLQTPLALLGGLGLAASLGAAVLATDLGEFRGLQRGELATPKNLGLALFGDHVVIMEITGLLLVVAAVGALTLTHRDRIRPKTTQRELMEERMRAYAQDGIHPGQKPMPGVYASTNTAAAPALAASGEALVDSVPRPLVARGQELELGDVAPELAAAQRAGQAALEAPVKQSGMASMPGAAAPGVIQPVAPRRARVQATPADTNKEDPK